MALFVVERDLSNVAPDHFRISQRDVASACIQLKSRGKRIRYISSAVMPVEGRGLDLFGADSSEVVKEAQDMAGVAYSRITEILDLTPSSVRPRSRRTGPSLQLQSVGRDAAAKAKGINDTMSAYPDSELARWLSEGQRFFRLCLEALEAAEHLQTRLQAVEGDNEILREELVRLRHKADLLLTERAEMVAAFNDLAGHVTQVVDHILQKSEDGENAR